MKYNSKIVKALSNISNNFYHELGIFPEQADAAKNIIKSFTLHIEDEEQERNNHVLLIAKMQSGKTGVCNSAVNLLRDTKMDKAFGIDKYYFITGMDANALHQQTLTRAYQQIKNPGKIVSKPEEIEKYPDAKIFVFKNSNLRKSGVQLEKCIIFIDESHYGSKAENVLTKFLSDNEIDWKNRIELKNKQIYIVSVSATPFDEVDNDIVQCKTEIVLNTTEDYIGVTEYLDRGLIFPALHPYDKEKDSRRLSPHEYILSNIKDAYDRMGKRKKGILFIRLSSSKSEKMKEEEFVKQNFESIDLDTSKGGSIDFEKIKWLFKLLLKDTNQKPIIFFIKGAYRAGQSLNEGFDLGTEDIKNYIYMIYDFSANPETTAQGLLGRMCGYRLSKGKINNTHFFINLQHAMDYSSYEENNFIRDNTPSLKIWKKLEDDKEPIPEGEYVLSAESYKPREKLLLSTTQIKELRDTDKKYPNRRIPIRLFLNKYYPNIKFDFVGDTYLKYLFEPDSGNYSEAVQIRWFEDNNNINAFRASVSDFKEYSGRDELDVKKDRNKLFIHVTFMNNELILHHGILIAKSLVKRTGSSHKNTDIQE